MSVWIISQHGVPIVCITRASEAMIEWLYLSYHGDGYTLTEVTCESKAGDYARGNLEAHARVA